MPGARRTVVVYAHYDGQPVDPSAWATPSLDADAARGPLEDGAAVVDLAAPGAIGPEWRLYARSASDDKAPIVAARGRPRRAARRRGARRP